MSVIHFSAKELAEVISVTIGNRSSLDGQRRFERYLEGFAQFSRENTQAYEATYSDKAHSYTTDEIKAAMILCPTVHNFRRAISTMRLAHYNLISNNGEDFGSKETMAFLYSVVCRLGFDMCLANNFREPAAA